LKEEVPRLDIQNQVRFSNQFRLACFLLCFRFLLPSLLFLFCLFFVYVTEEIDILIITRFFLLFLLVRLFGLFMLVFGVLGRCLRSREAYGWLVFYGTQT